MEIVYTLGIVVILFTASVLVGSGVVKRVDILPNGTQPVVLWCLGLLLWPVILVICSVLAVLYLTILWTIVLGVRLGRLFPKDSKDVSKDADPDP